MKKFWQSGYLSLALVALGLGMIAYGYANGELDVYLIKSINICLECVGIG